MTKSFLSADCQSLRIAMAKTRLQLASLLWLKNHLRLLVQVLHPHPLHTHTRSTFGVFLLKMTQEWMGPMACPPTMLEVLLTSQSVLLSMLAQVAPTMPLSETRTPSWCSFWLSCQIKRPRRRSRLAHGQASSLGCPPKSSSSTKGQSQTSSGLVANMFLVASRKLVWSWQQSTRGKALLPAFGKPALQTCNRLAPLWWLMAILQRSRAWVS